MLKAAEKANFPNKWKDLAAVGSPINEELFDRDAMFSVAVQRRVHLRLAREFGLSSGYSNYATAAKVEATWTLPQKHLFRSKWASDPWRAALDIWIQRGAHQVAHIYRPVVPRTLPLKFDWNQGRVQNGTKNELAWSYHVIYLRATLLEGWFGPFSLAHARRKINFWPEPF